MEAEALQVGDEVGHDAFEDALALAQDVQLGKKKKGSKSGKHGAQRGPLSCSSPPMGHLCQPPPPLPGLPSLPEGPRAPSQTLSNISKSLALGWWMVQMMVRPPCARERIRDTTWKQEALSKPLRPRRGRKRRKRKSKERRGEVRGEKGPPQKHPPTAGTLFFQGHGGGHPVAAPLGVPPGGLIKEHHRGVVHQLQGDGQALALPPRERAGAGVGALQQPQRRQDLVDLGAQPPSPPYPGDQDPRPVPTTWGSLSPHSGVR